MERSVIMLLALSTMIACITLSCQKEFSCEGCNTANQPSIAVAGADQFITLPIDSVLLNGTASHDPDGYITTLV